MLWSATFMTATNVKVVPMKYRSASEWVKAYDHIHQEITAKGFKQKLQTLDNEASAALKHFFTANDVEYQLVPPHCHRRNAAERAIRTFKEHFVAGLSSVDPTFPFYLWDRLLPQAEITLNLLGTSRLHPQLSASAHFHGLVDYNKIYFAPPGCKIIAHEKPEKRCTWAPHGQHGYSLGPAIHHYRCQNVYISVTASERIVDTLEFFPHNYQMSQLSSTVRLLMAANEMSNALQNPHPEVPFTHAGDDTISALTALADIFQTQISKSSQSHTPSSSCQGHSAHMPRRIIQSNRCFSHAPAAPNEITDNNSRSIDNQRAITSEGGHTNDEPAFTSEDAKALTKSRSPQLIPRRILRHGHCPHGNRPGKSPLVPGTSIQCSRSPHHRKRNGIHGPYERPPSETTLDTGFWQQSRAPFSRHLGYSRNRHMFLYQTYKHPERHKDHVRQNSLRLQTPQKIKGTG
jgi:hypothetical protein